MPKFSLSKSGTKAEKADGDALPSPKSSTMKKLPGKITKGVKRQLWKLDEIFHHVTHTAHRARSSSASSLSPCPTTINVVRTIVPSSPSGSHDTWDIKYVREVDLQSIERASLSSVTLSIDPLPIFPPSTADFGLSVPTMPDEHPQGYPLPEPPVEEIRDEVPSNSESVFTNPPTVFVEAETPDPFLIDEEGDALSEDEDSSAAVSQLTVSPAHDVPLDLPEPDNTQQQAPTSPLPNLNKDVPPPPSSESEEEDEIPDIYVPTLITPTMFLPIPNTDPLTILLNKYIYPPEKRPPRDLTGDWQRSDFHTLVMTNSWRALARMARDRLVTSDPSDLTLILGLWHLRLSCLARLRLFNQTSAECTNLFTALSAIDPPEAREYVFERILPFELEVMQTRLKYWAGDHMGYLDALSALLKKCRIKCRQSGSDPTLVPMWKERGARVCLIIASQMIEMKEITAAAKLLEPLCKQGNISSPALRSSVGRIYLQGGNIQMAAKQFALVEADPSAEDTLKTMNAALLASSEGDWVQASEKLREILEKDADDYVAVNNLSVALLSQGKLKEGIEVLERAMQASPSSVVVAEPFLFNLSTLYELRSTAGFEKKKELLVDVAKWSGDGLKTNCLKMPAN